MDTPQTHMKPLKAIIPTTAKTETIRHKKTQWTTMIS
jgi:hypothetical protein